MSAVLGAKPTAALSSGLLARKGQARPAMRSPAPGPLGAPDDLGWNDMGAPVPDATPAPLERPAAHPVSPAAARRIGRESAKRTSRGKAAFTLRLDGPRHLRLRLAGAVAHRSAQALVTDALDAWLAGMPEVEALAAQLPAGPREGGK